MYIDLFSLNLFSSSQESGLGFPLYLEFSLLVIVKSGIVVMG